MAKNFTLRIALQPSNRGSKQQDVTDDERSCLREFLLWPDITYVTPGKNDQVYMRKVNGQKLFRQKKHLLWTLTDVLDIANGY